MSRLRHRSDPALHWRPRLGTAVVLAAIAALPGAPASAQGWQYDGPELARFALDYERLRDASEPTTDPSLAARVAYFNGFVLGVVRANADRGWFCLPVEATAGDVWDVVAKFLRDYPQLAEGRPSTLVNGALARRFPCAERPASSGPDVPPAAPGAAKPMPKPKSGTGASRTP